MGEHMRRLRAHDSVFAKLLAIMLAMAASLLLMVGGFFGFIVGPSLSHSIDRLVEDYVHGVAASSPDLEAAQRLRARIGLRMRYEGPGGAWATDESLPAVESLNRPAGERLSLALHGRDYYAVAASNGGTYLFTWKFGHMMDVAHLTLLALLLCLMVVVVLTAHAVLRRLLRPLRSLGDGVARLSEGDLDVVLTQETRDEFGTLTNAFNRMVRRVREMIQARDQLLLDVSHELRSPVTRLKVALALLPDGDKKARMAADVTEMERMIAELLELERLRDGRGITVARADLAGILRELVDSFQDKPPGVELICASGEILLDIDADKIRTVLRNLLENAVKYSLPDSRAVQVSAAQDTASVVVRITDDGAGIPEGDVASLFEPFFRVDRSRSKKTGGYGLGLSICKRIVEAHGAGISAEQNADRGASFIVTLRKTLPGAH